MQNCRQNNWRKRRFAYAKDFGCGTVLLENKPSPNHSRSLWVALLIGACLMAGIDEIVFHQLLAWHHFYDQSTPAIGLLSDGLLHAAELIGLVAGFFMYADLRRSHSLAPRRAWAGFFMGMGGFQIFDGIVDHKLLRVHQVRYGVDNLFIYDLLWNLGGLILLLIGVWLLVKARSATAPQQANT
ncbi:DUF2243 domain-containing protein [Cesiribacter sp. SM1]|uniref:DUF2243 domain-containing protein n=1 Tax=Cesiribacter sp. SM1 TaxID=2861196 RepID=UPI001CD534D0|nr:DUF2243 domain-containing protein [Cesiribacter sp. SM1]